MEYLGRVRRQREYEQDRCWRLGRTGQPFVFMVTDSQDFPCTAYAGAAGAAGCNTNSLLPAAAAVGRLTCMMWEATGRAAVSRRGAHAGRAGRTSAGMPVVPGGTAADTPATPRARSHPASTTATSTMRRRHRAHPGDSVHITPRRAARFAGFLMLTPRDVFILISSGAQHPSAAAATGAGTPHATTRVLTQHPVVSAVGAALLGRASAQVVAAAGAMLPVSANGRTAAAHAFRDLLHRR